MSRSRSLKSIKVFAMTVTTCAAVEEDDERTLVGSGSASSTSIEMLGGWDGDLGKSFSVSLNDNQPHLLGFLTSLSWLCIQSVRA